MAASLSTKRWVPEQPLCCFRGRLPFARSQGASWHSHTYHTQHTVIWHHRNIGWHPALERRGLKFSLLPPQAIHPQAHNHLNECVCV